MNTLIDQIFDKLDKWRTFPAYQLERRADIFFAIYLQKILKYKFQIDAITILPEFPIRLGTIFDNEINQSFKVDYVAFTKDEVFFIELKTDMGSLRAKQYEYLLLASKVGMPKLIEGLLKIYQATKAKKKYENYLDELVKLGGLVKDRDGYNVCISDLEIRIVFLQPNINTNELPVATITFNDCIEALKNEEDPIAHRFIKSLKKWKNNMD